MKGLYTELKTSDSSNNAFVMTMGSLVAVEFGGLGNAFYGYDKRRALPFDMSQPVVTTKNARNSLKHDQRILWMQHQDGIHGWNKWEKMFEATLREKFGIRPDVVPQRVPARAVPLPVQPAASSQPASRPPRAPTPPGVGNFSMSSLASWAEARNLTIVDHRQQNGNLWVRTDDSDQQVNAVLLAWNFQYRPSRGWWRQ
jgi:hypothetical protein